MTIEAIRDHIYDHMGNDIEIIHNEGRNRIIRYVGKVTEAYQNIFIVLDHDSKRSFSYYDVLTNTVKISFKM